jgi:hypothetical protein
VLLYHSLAYLQCHWVCGVGLNDVNISSAYFSGNLGLDGCFFADEAEHGIGRVLRELAEELELDDEVRALVTQVLCMKQE